MQRSLAQLLSRLSEIHRELERHGIRSVSDYAEQLVAQAFHGERAGYISKGFDVLTEAYGRVEVKCRVLPRDGRREERVQVGSAKSQGFDHLAIIIFRPDYSVKHAVLVPYRQVWGRASRHKYRRLSYKDACSFRGAKDITRELTAAQKA